MPSQTSDTNNSIGIIFIKIIIKINITKICMKNIYFITKKYDIIRIFVKIFSYIFIYLQISIKCFNHFICNKHLGISFNDARESSTPSSSSSLSFIFSGLLKKGLQKQLCHSVLSIRNRIKYKKHLLTALSHIS